MFSNFIHIIVTFTSQSKQSKYIYQHQITCLMFYLFFGIEKKVNLEKNTFSVGIMVYIDMYVGEKLLFPYILICLEYICSVRLQLHN